jgi:hypothetical protein
MNKHEAITYAKNLMTERNYCENARSRVLLSVEALFNDKEDVPQKRVQELVIGIRR